MSDNQKKPRPTRSIDTDELICDLEGLDFVEQEDDVTAEMDIEAPFGDGIETSDIEGVNVSLIRSRAKL